MQGHVAIVNGLKNIHGFVYPIANLHYIEHKVYNLLSIAGPTNSI